MVFKNGCALDLAVPIRRMACLGTGHWGCGGVGRESLPPLMGMLSACLRPDRVGRHAWPWVARQWCAQTVVGTSTAGAGGSVWWFPALSALVATRPYWRWQKFSLGACCHGLCPGAWGLSRPPASFCMAAWARAGKCAYLWQPVRRGPHYPGRAFSV